MESLEDLQAILDGAPKDGNATHASIILPNEEDILNYVNVNDFTWWHDSLGEWRGWGGVVDSTFRSLADIQRIVDFMKLINHFNKSLGKVAAHIQKSQPSFCMGGVDSDDEFSSAGKIIGYIENLEGCSNVKVNECLHPPEYNVTHYNHNECKACGKIRTDSGFGVASNMWFDNLQAAKFYEKNGFIPT